ncbi:ral GTPase-activating protein subunit alpha-1-like [Saccoglossus kowalevskii]|uniref:Ral GTPase-activating protein subunit alpha-1-like n=1 Tax=Saccoglossus kowalevskii TaxID=10224 RepID=A0ABM0MXW8_SACKO|nr:PREDICTED: ral GTPase-activating protein subunit alpha-1-like [Saccoglossus kowalevskii]
MFSKKQHGDVKKSSQKVLDPKKDALTRLKHLRVVLDHYDASEAKSFFEQYYSHIFQIFYDNFISVESTLKQKVHKAQREELDGILFVFEKILLFLPDYIHERWQFHCIGRLMKKLLHPGNALKLRREGIRLFLLWFQALQEHADDECYLIYATLIPGFPLPSSASTIHTLDSLINNSARPPSSVFLDFTATAVTPVEITPLIALQAGEKQPENITKFLLESVLHFSVSQITKMDWRDSERKERSFIFLFENFKKYYLPHVFPEFSWKTSLFDPVLDVPDSRSFSEVNKGFDETDSGNQVSACRVAVIRWVVAFTLNIRKLTNKTSGQVPDVIGNDNEHNRDLSKLTHEQVDLCKRVLHIYRHVVMHVSMSKKTWEQLLMVLLRISEVILKKPPDRGKQSLSKQLAALVFQTLIVTWIKANLNVAVSIELWDELLRVLSSLTHWQELIKEWAKTMETLTRVLARHVYNLDLSDLPLDKLSEQKQKRRFGKIGHMKKSSGRHERSFSKGWSRTDSMSPHAQEELERLRLSMTGMGTRHGKPGDGEGFRQRSATTVGPGAADENALLTERLRHRSSGETHSRAGDEGQVISRRQLYRQQSYSQTERDPREDDDSGTLMKSSSAGDLVTMSSEFRLKGQSFSSEISNVSSSSGFTMSTGTDTLSIGDVVTGTNLSQSEDQELASLTAFVDTASLDSTSQGDQSGGQSNSSMFEIGRVSPPVDAPDDGEEEKESRSSEEKESRSSSRSSSPNMFLQPKDSPTQESLHLENVVVSGDELDAPEAGDHFDSDVACGQSATDMNCHVILGGSRQGWLPDVAVVLWRRMLGILGDINEIKDPVIHAEVYEYLWDLWIVFSKTRENLGISLDNLSTPPPPRLVPPLRMFSPWLFKAVSLGKNYQRGRLLAYQLLCSMTVRRNDHSLPMDHLVQFYRILHHGLVGTDQEVINTIVRYTSPMFFSCNLPGSTMLILDYIQATNMIVSTPDLEAPRVEAISLLGSLICHPNMFCNIHALQPNTSEISLMTCKDVKDHIITILLKAARKELHFEARCVALSALGVFIYEEVLHGTYHSKLREAINVLLATIKFSNKAVAQVASDMLLFLCDQADKLRRHQPEMPKKIIEVVALTILSLLPSTEASHIEDDKKLMVSLLFCLLEWCMSLPIKVLGEPVERRSDKDNKPLLNVVFKVLQAAVQGANSQQKHVPVNFSDFASNDYDPHLYIDNIRESYYNSGPNSPRTPVQTDTMEDFLEEDLMAPFIDDFQRRSPDVIRLAAKTVMGYLVNHLGHYPLGCGPARINSLISEYSDDATIDVDELSTDLFSCSNVQFFIVNDSCLMSYVEIPAELEVPGGGITAGLTTAKTQSRVIVRALSGKFVWDSAILYGPPHCAMSSNSDYLSNCNTNNNADSSSEEDANNQRSQHQLLVKQRSKLPSWEEAEETEDVLNELLKYIGHTSNECLQRPGRPLNIPAPPPEEITHLMEESVKATLLKQSDNEEEYVIQHGTDTSMVSKEQKPWPHTDPASPFYICRAMLSQLGMLTWDKRANFDLVKKNDKLIRELKNLDSQLRHLGNDEIHIVWSEHTRDYRRGIIATEFGDVLICIYPLPSQLYRIQIKRKPEVPYFGPLFDGAIVDHKVLPGLVRATAINASRIKRSSIPLYQRFYEERAKYLEGIVKNHKEHTTFEEFASHVYAPAHDRTPRVASAKSHLSEVSSVTSLSSISTTGTFEHTGSVSSIRSTTSSQQTVASSHSRIIKDDRSSTDSHIVAVSVDDPHHVTFTKPSSKQKLTTKGRQQSSTSVKDSTPPDSPAVSLKGKRTS